jgi:hypothetical protein
MTINEPREGMCYHGLFNTSGVVGFLAFGYPGFPPGANNIGRRPASGDIEIRELVRKVTSWWVKYYI